MQWAFQFFGEEGDFCLSERGDYEPLKQCRIFLLVSPLYKRWLLLPFLDNKWDKINIRPLIIENRYIAQIFSEISFVAAEMVSKAGSNAAVYNTCNCIRSKNIARDPIFIRWDRWFTFQLFFLHLTAYMVVWFFPRVFSFIIAKFFPLFFVFIMSFWKK